MSAAEARPTMTAEEYLAFEREAETRHELVNGEIVAMAGASREHALIISNLARVLGNQLLERPCEVYTNEMRVKVSATGAYLYPDVAAACGDIRFEDTKPASLLTPTVVIEILSPSTAVYDRGEKGFQYRALPSLQHLVLISQDEVLVEVYTRQGDDWLLSTARHMDEQIVLPAVGCRLVLRDVYFRVEFPSAGAAATGEAPA